MYLSFTGGPILEEIERDYGAAMVRPFYCCVDPAHYFPETCPKKFDLGYLGTYSPDRQPALDRLLSAPAAMDASSSFLVAGPMYPEVIHWPCNVERVEHVPPSKHRAFYNSQRFTLNITRQNMVRWGYSPSVRLFEAAACGIPIITDPWAGLPDFFEPGEEILTAQSAKDVQGYLRGMAAEEAQAVAEKARQRVVNEHTAAHRVAQLEAWIMSFGNSS